MMTEMTIDALANSVALQVEGAVDYWPEYDRKDITSERIVVTPEGIAYAHMSRNLVQTDYLIAVGILRRATEDDVPGLVKKVQRLGRMLLGRQFIAARCVDVKYDPLYSIDHLRERRQFTAVLRLTLRTAE